MVETAINKLNEMDNEFMKEANKIKSATAVYGMYLSAPNVRVYYQ